TSGQANANATNFADVGSQAGNDTIRSGNGDDTISGGSQAKSVTGVAHAATGNTANNGSAGDDSIIADGDVGGDDVVAGEAQALSESGFAYSEGYNGDSDTLG